MSDIAHKAGEIHLRQIRYARGDVRHESEWVSQKVHRPEDTQSLGTQLDLKVQRQLVPEEAAEFEAVTALKFT